MSQSLPDKALVVVADGTSARMLRVSGKGQNQSLRQIEELNPKNLDDDGPFGARPPEQSAQETDEATFAKQLAQTLYSRAHSGDYEALLLVADPETMGQIRPQLHKEVQDKIVGEISKTLTSHPLKDIEKSILG